MSTDPLQVTPEADPTWPVRALAGQLLLTSHHECTTTDPRRAQQQEHRKTH